MLDPHPDVNARLRTAAKRSISPPDFDEALRMATAAHRSDIARLPRERRRPTRSWLAAAAAVVALLAGVVILSVIRGPNNEGPGPAASHPLPSPVSFTPRTVGIILGPPDPNTGRSQYMVFTTAPHASPSSKSFSVEPSARSRDCVDAGPVDVIETATQLRVRAAVLDRPSGEFHCETQGLPDPLDSDLLAGAVSALKDPLGNRAVVDDRTGRPIKVFVPTYPHPAHIPAGYAAIDANDTEPMGTTWSDARAGFLAPMSVAETFGAEHGPNRDKPGLVVVEAPYNAVNPGAAVVDHVSINGHDATVTEIATARCVTWSPDANKSLQVCADDKQITHATGHDLLSEDELIRVARSIP